MASLSFTEADIQRIAAGAWTDHVEYRPVVGSTSDHARAWAAGGQRGTLLAIADEQLAGRGRGANRWWTGHGSLAVSLLFDPAELGIARRHSAMIALAGAAAIVDVAQGLVAPADVQIRWPNDVYIGQQKLAGILVEALPCGRHIVGIGLNVNNRSADAPPELAASTATLADYSGQTHDRSAVLLDMLTNFRVTLEQLAAAPETLARRADRLFWGRGRRVNVQVADQILEGILAGIAEDGSLLLDTPAGQRHVYSGSILKTEN